MPFFTRPRSRAGIGLSVIANGPEVMSRIAAGLFIPDDQIREVEPLAGGHINETFLVHCAEVSENFILQRLNSRVFPESRGLMANLELLFDHLPAVPFLPRPLPTMTGRFYWQDNDLWRAFAYVAGCCPGRENADPGQGAEAGKILGRFHSLTADLSPAGFMDPLPGFHVTSVYLAHYDKVCQKLKPEPRESNCHAFIASRRSRARVLESARFRGELEPGIIHGDPRLANILFDKDDGRARVLIDLDTADMIRSCSQDQNGCFVTNCCEATIVSYLAEAGSLLTPGDLDYLFDAIWLLPYELGLRFFSDYLAGNRYFQVSDEKDNLGRAEDQFALVASIESQEDEIRWIIDQQTAPFRTK